MQQYKYIYIYIYNYICNTYMNLCIFAYTYMYGNCSSQPPHLTEARPQWLSGPSLVTPAAESPPNTKPGQTVFYALQILFNYRHRLTKNA